MEKQQLMEYLTAVCNAESVAQSCHENIDMLEKKKAMVRNISSPAAPQHEPPKTFYNDDSIGSLLIEVLFLKGFLINIVLSLVFAAFIQTVIGTSDKAIIISLCTGFVLVCTIRVFIRRQRSVAKTEQLQAAENARAQQANRIADQKYEISYLAYKRGSELRSQLLDALDNAISEQNALLTAATQRLDVLYNMNILHTSCRSLVAAYQIREYLEMGICETLEGPNGAYKQYQYDVLAQRVCTSIDDMKKSLSAAIYSLQSTLVQELRQINQSVQDMNTTLHSDFDRVNANIDLFNRQTREQIDAGFRDANEHRANINRNLAISTHNDYIEKRINGVDTYLLKAPETVQ